MRHARRLYFGSIGVAALTLCIALSGCGAAPTTNAGKAAATSTPSPWPTLAPFPTATPAPLLVSAVEQLGCPAFEDRPFQAQYTSVDGLKVSIPKRLTMLDYPSELMPSNAPSAPYKVPLTASEAQIGAFHPNPPVNPSLSTGYAMQVCNQTSAAHTVSSISVNIASFTPRSGPVTVWHLCGDGPYDAATRQTTGGCGGSFGQVDWLAVNLSSNNTGASANAVANTVGGASGGPNPPVVIGPNDSIVFVIAVNGLVTPGTYTLSVGLGVDGRTTATLTPSDGAFLIAPAATVWTGTACQTPAMQAQIPATTQDVYYVCPPNS